MKKEILKQVIELRRREKDVCFFKGRQECDFLIKKGTSMEQAVQVTSFIPDDRVKRREINGLIECCKAVGLQEDLIVSQDLSSEETIDDITVSRGC